MTWIRSPFAVGRSLFLGVQGGNCEDLSGGAQCGHDFGVLQWKNFEAEDISQFIQIL